MIFANYILSWAVCISGYRRNQYNFQLSIQYIEFDKNFPMEKEGISNETYFST